MKKFAALLLAAALLLLPAPFSSPASAASDDGIVDMRGTKTYIGTSAEWANVSDLTEVTDDDVSWGGNLTVKAGTIDGLSVSGNLTVSGGTAGDASCSGQASLSGGTLKSIDAGGDITMSGGSVKHDMTSDEGDIILSGTFSIGGSVTAASEVRFSSGTVAVSGTVTGEDVTLSAAANAKVSGSVEVAGKLLLYGGKLTASKIDGSGEGTVEVDGFSGSLPTLDDIDGFKVDSDQKAVLNQKLVLGTLSLASDAEFVTYSPLEVDSISGPGTLCIDSGDLTVHEGITELPLLLFNDAVGAGDTAFRADSGAVSEYDVQTYGYDFEAVSSGNGDLFRLELAGSQGLSLNQSSLTVGGGSSATVNASVSPSFSQYATGTQIVWQLDGDSSAFAISPNSGGMSCRVSASSSVSGKHKAILTAYLADKSKNYLSDYRADSCVLSTGYTDQTSVSLDTSYVSLLVGNSYGLLATTNASVAPNAISYNSSVAAITGTKAVRDKYGNPGWLYTVTGRGNGSTSIDVNGSLMSVTVNSGILMDTMSYTMAPGAFYCAGVLTRGVDETGITVYSTSASAKVAFYKKGSDGVILYRVTGVQAGSADIVFAVAGGQSVKMSVSVAQGAASSGRSARLVALKQ